MYKAFLVEMSYKVWIGNGTENHFISGTCADLKVLKIWKLLILIFITKMARILE